MSSLVSPCWAGAALRFVPKIQKIHYKSLADQESHTGGRECLQGSQERGGPCGVQEHWRGQERPREVALDAFMKKNLLQCNNLARNLAIHCNAGWRAV